MKTHEIFSQVLAKLNAEQRRAVDTIEGPVMVVAGPGTGKTQILAARIGNILQKTDTAPHNILCLTYTDSGAIAMRKRLAEFIGPTAYRVHIHTFHGFCNMVIQENPQLFGNWDLKALSDLEKQQLFNQHIDGFPVGHALRRDSAAVYFEKSRMSSLFDTMKKESWSADFICEKADEYIADLPNREDFVYKKDMPNAKKGDIKPSKYNPELKAMELLKAAAREFEPFQQRMQEASRYDYNDMILWVIREFEQNEELLLRYQEQFLYMLVDEYQDTSGAQNELLYKLAGYWGDQPNLFVVGDDDQSIYKFQGANVENILEFRKKYSKGEYIVLSENYRSVQGILDAAQGFIETNKERLVGRIEGLSKNLQAANPVLKELPNKPRIIEYANEVQETVAIGEYILEAKQRGEKLSEIAVLYHRHAHAEDLIKFLQLQGVAVNTRRKVDVLYEPDITHLLMLLEYIAAELHVPHSGEYLLFHILHFNLYKIHPLQVAKLSSDIYQQKKKWRDLLQSEQKVTQQTDLFAAAPAESERKEMYRVANMLEECIKEAQNRTVLGLLEFVINQSGLLAYMVTSPDRTWLMQVLTTFFAFVREESQRNPKLTIVQLLETIQLMMDNRISIPLVKATTELDGVNFITAHSSKGLEFETVFILNAIQKSWEDAGNNSKDYKIPDTIITSTGGDAFEELRRLFFVAMTRAKKNLFISYPVMQGEKPSMASQFIAELLELPGIEKEQQAVLDDSKIAFFQQEVLRRSDEVSLMLPEYDYIERLLQNFALSPTSLSVYLKCPVSFYYSQLLRVPAAMNEFMAYGSAVHNSLDWLFKEMKKRDEVFPSAQELVENFFYQMKRLEANFTEVQYKKRREFGESQLQNFYDYYVKTWNKVASTELNLKNIEVDGIPVKGKIDKIEFNGSAAVVIDYKTGGYDKALKKLKGPDAEADPENAKFEALHGGDYWRQAVFYKILIDNYKLKSWQVHTALFDFIEPDKKSGEYKQAKIVISKEDEAVVKKQIQAAWKGIRAHEFSKGCNDEKCDWCNFVKSLPEEFSKATVVEEIEDTFEE